MANSKKNIKISLLGIFILFSITSTVYSFGNNKIIDKESNSLYIQEKFDTKEQYQSVIDRYLNALEEKRSDSLSVFQKLAFTYSEMKEPELAVQYINRYVKASLDISFVGHSFFDNISDSEPYELLANKYLKKVDLWSIFCLYTGFIGFFVALVLNLRKRSDKVANLLMSFFVLLHSFFILHICALLTNYQYYFSDSLYISTSFSFLYGPLIYFYFKRVINKYVFRNIDLLHLVPTLLLIVFLLLPVYFLSAEEKLKMMLNGTVPHGTLITIVKLISLIVYGGLVLVIYIKSIKSKKPVLRMQSIWQRNIVIFCSLYIVTYSIYAFLIISKIYSGILFNTQVGLMAFLVLYVSYTAFVQPSIFGGLKVIKTKPKNKVPVPKYVKSGLTEGLSVELKEKLLYLLNEEKIYKQNNITLQVLSELMDTTRHNTSQIINEHFNLNFFELINKYRIEEAKELLKGEKHKNFNIIDIAYEVGFNNKVTFNKSFKKYNQVTPSEYLKSLVA
ncbi:transcriptional regulator, AraC family [Aquimarina amphilecti]|uniref:Transcriptional regulator, AraC family n=1 Tax=Aquimarina amphilecti TaxID=1038014 RepID=A0A1H7PT09_AQUAM|nr:helix-turn-helix transcriptional regulator [Aquimarina amphilecti]SEL38892.1 transcriptional regulator, AraC family [Aquimarina amphilecti]